MSSLCKTGSAMGQPFGAVRLEFRVDQARATAAMTGFLDAPPFAPSGHSYGYRENGGEQVALPGIVALDGRL